ncbi:nucleolar protein 7 [Syngnathoides biaculeatus]|uniref:nucleolar protein 7 n=1 Tax=Syngnathoides biaculeatus TaxID=300417 RepID=UPI002ADDB72D|nr:nucleolar protein 7 [Syngnathoides biaculeatus]
MSPKKRGVRARCNKADRSDEVMANFRLELCSSDDEAPEEVTFEDSKAQALRSVKQALESARREKDLLKERRKKRQELFQEQKKRKLLSAELLEEIDSLQEKKRKRKRQNRSQSNAEATSQDEDHHQQEEMTPTKKKQQKLEHSRKLKGNYKVMTVKPQALAYFQKKAAEDFLESRLYGKGSRRATSSQELSLQNKTASTKGGAVQFVKSQWAREKKSKAEKLKLRWIRKKIASI